MSEMTGRFRVLQASGFFALPNPWDVGSAVRLQRLGFAALATTSSGHAWPLALEDQQLTFDQLLAHVGALTAVLTVPLSVDAERMYADAPAEVADNVRALAEGFLYGMADLGETIHRLRSYRAAGADVVYAPGGTAPADITRLVNATNSPLNVLLRPDGPTPAELAALGVRRASTGGALARTAYTAMESAAADLLAP